ncbi:hypothetical protein BN903_108 [Halorubrum sp. AJ67]|nr:hypothetical protein BN903_108 [Halorubrum sp. AJ67]
MKLEHVDVVGVEPVERGLERLGEVLAVQLLRQFAVAGLRVVVEIVADLRRQRHLVAAAVDGPPDYLLAVAVAVHVAGVDVGDARVERVLDHPDRLFVGAVAPPIGADDPRAEADLGDLDAGVPQFAVLHTH